MIYDVEGDMGRRWGRRDKEEGRGGGTGEEGWGVKRDRGGDSYVVLLHAHWGESTGT